MYTFTGIKQEMVSGNAFSIIAILHDKLQQGVQETITEQQCTSKT